MALVGIGKEFVQKIWLFLQISSKDFVIYAIRHLVRIWSDRVFFILQNLGKNFKIFQIIQNRFADASKMQKDPNPNNQKPFERSNVNKSVV